MKKSKKGLFPFVEKFWQEWLESDSGHRFRMVEKCSLIRSQELLVFDKVVLMNNHFRELRDYLKKSLLQEAECFCPVCGLFFNGALEVCPDKNCGGHAIPLVRLVKVEEVFGK